jgi:uncharacterized protein YkwD
MKKLFITTACTLLLSLFGALGANQNSFQIKNTLNKELNTETNEQQETVQETAKDIKGEEVQALPSKTNTNIASGNDVENKAKVTKAVKKEAVTKQKKTAPVADAAKDSAKKENIIKATATNQKKNAAPAVNSQKANNCITPAGNTASNKAVLNSDTIEKIVYDSSENCYTLNGKVIAYGNVDLSEFDSVEDILAKLKDSGFKVEIPSNSSCNNNNNNNNNSNNNNSNNNNSNNNSNDTPTQPAKPTPTPDDNTDTQNNSGLSSYANQVLQLVNQERAKAGLSALTTNSTLTAAANKRAQETKQSFSHTRPNGTSFSTVLKEYNISYRTAGENIAYGQRTPSEVVNGWMNSSGHRANILNANFNKIGIGVYEANGTIYWSQLFTN